MDSAFGFKFAVGILANPLKEILNCPGIRTNFFRVEFELQIGAQFSVENGNMFRLDSIFPSNWK